MNTKQLFSSSAARSGRNYRTGTSTKCVRTCLKHCALTFISEVCTWERRMLLILFILQLWYFGRINFSLLIYSITINWWVKFSIKKPFLCLQEDTLLFILTESLLIWMNCCLQKWLGREFIIGYLVDWLLWVCNKDCLCKWNPAN